MEYVVPIIKIQYPLEIIEDMLNSDKSMDELMNRIFYKNEPVHRVINQRMNFAAQINHDNLHMASALVYHLLDISLEDGQSLPPTNLRKWSNLVDLVYNSSHLIKERAKDVIEYDPTMIEVFGTITFKGFDKIESDLIGYDCILLYLWLEDSLLHHNRRLKLFTEAVEKID